MDIQNNETDRKMNEEIKERGQERGRDISTENPSQNNCTTGNLKR